MNKKLNLDATSTDGGSATGVEDEEDKDIIIPDFDIRGELFEVTQTKAKRGKDANKLRFIINTDVSQPNPFAKIEKVVGRDNFLRSIIAEVVRQACIDSTKQAMVDGQVDELKYGQAFVEWFLPETRRAAGGAKALREKMAKLFTEELKPLLDKLVARETLSAEEEARYQNLVIEYSELNAKTAPKTTGKKKA